MAIPSSLLLRSVPARLRAAGCVDAEDEARLLIAAAPTSEELDVMIDRRTAGLPLEYILGWAWFCRMRISLDPGVFVPRRRSEVLVRESVALAHPGAIVVDLCCGSGAIGVALTTNVSRVELHAVDVDEVAVRCARRNTASAGGRVYEGDLYDPLPTTLRGRVDLVVASPPYVPSDHIRFLPAEARVHEPRVALDGGEDGLDVVRRLIAEAPAWLAPGGHVLVETSERQVSQTVEVLTHAALAARVALSDGLDASVVIGTRPRRGAS
jgi:release factor glutamine methyltransferase